MNRKQNIAQAIIEAVTDCCVTELDLGKPNFTTKEVLGKSHAENVVLTRQIIAMQLNHLGYTSTTIAQLFKCTQARARDLIRQGYVNLDTRRAFQYAYAEATIRVKEIIS